MLKSATIYKTRLLGFPRKEKDNTLSNDWMMIAIPNQIRIVMTRKIMSRQSSRAAIADPDNNMKVILMIIDILISQIQLSYTYWEIARGGKQEA